MWEARFPSVKVLFLSEIFSTLTIMLYFLPELETNRGVIIVQGFDLFFKSIGLSVTSVFIFH